MNTALVRLRSFLEENDTTLYATNPAGLAEIERGFMVLMRATLGPRVRLVGVPIGVRDWRTYVRLYCAYLVSAGNISAPWTIFVSLPEPPEAHSAHSGPAHSMRAHSRGPRPPSTGPQDEMRVCLLRADAIGNPVVVI